MNIHEVEADPEPFDDTLDGIKTVEVRQNDRNYSIDGMLTMVESVDSAWSQKIIVAYLELLEY